MAHHLKRSFRVRHVPYVVLSAAVLFAALYFLFNAGSISHRAAADLKYTDQSPSGLTVVPASGGSQVSYGQTCTPGQWDSSSCRRCTGTGQWAANCTDYGGPQDPGFSSAAWCSCSNACTGTVVPACAPPPPVCTPGEWDSNACRRCTSAGQWAANCTDFGGPNDPGYTSAKWCTCSVQCTGGPASCVTPAETSYTPTQTSYTPTQTSYTPTQTSYTPTQTSYTPTQTSYGPAQTSYTPTETSYGGGGGGGGPGEPSYDNDDEQEQPPKHCFDGTVLPPNGKCSKCPTGYTETMSSSGYQTCIAPQPPKFVGFRAADGIQATGHLEVRPSLGRSGYVARVYWNVTNVRDCTVRGSNGDGASGSRTGPWNTSASGSSGKATSPITSRTDYTLFCRALVGATPSTITETRTVNVLPTWYEPSGF